LLFGDHSATDVLQETNVDLWARREEFDFDRPFLPWAFAFARQRVMAHRKTIARSRLLYSDEVLAAIESECARLASESDSRIEALKKCLKKLNSQQSQLLQERYQGRTSVKSMAARMGETAHNLSSQLHRIRKSLAKCIDSSLALEER
jgi:RNA polymerase sigma-70 factor, ECF subfamily